MRIGSFFLIVLMAFVAFGYLLSDSVHVRAELSNLQKDNERLTQAVTQTEQERQNTLIDLHSCQQSVSQLNQIIADNDNPKNQNSNVIGPDPQTKVVQSTTFNAIPFITLGLGSTGMLVLKKLQKSPLFRRHAIRKERYILLTDAEIEGVVRSRRRASKLRHPELTRDFLEGGEL